MWQFTLTLLIMGAVIRIFYVLWNALSNNCSLTVNRPNLKTILCIGSGGHTTEMLKLSDKFGNKYSPRLYIMADSDTTSEVKIHSKEKGNKDYELSKIPRSRKVHQTYSSSILSTLYSTWYTIPIIYSFKPDVIFCNGPGTCVPICIVAFWLRCLFLLDCRIVYVESICRVRSLSLSGKILLFFVDLFVVQWPDLRDNVFRTKYFGRLT